MRKFNFYMTEGDAADAVVELWADYERASAKASARGEWWKAWGPTPSERHFAMRAFIEAMAERWGVKTMLRVVSKAGLTFEINRDPMAETAPDAAAS